MASLTLNYKGAEVPCDFHKVERTQLYGSIRTEATDSNGHPCRLATLAGDGKTIIDSGGTALGQLSADGNWTDKTKLMAVDAEGNEVLPAPSSLKAPIALQDQASVDDYLSHIISTTYCITTPLPDDLVKQLTTGTIFTFPFSYRGGLSPDQGFLLAAADGSIWLALGKPAQINFVGLEQTAILEDNDDEQEDDDDLLDFGIN